MPPAAFFNAHWSSWGSNTAEYISSGSRRRAGAARAGAAWPAGGLRPASAGAAGRTMAFHPRCWSWTSAGGSPVDPGRRERQPGRPSPLASMVQHRHQESRTLRVASRWPAAALDSWHRCWWWALEGPAEEGLALQLPVRPFLVVMNRPSQGSCRSPPCCRGSALRRSWAARTWARRCWRLHAPGSR